MAWLGTLATTLGPLLVTKLLGGGELGKTDLLKAGKAISKVKTKGELRKRYNTYRGGLHLMGKTPLEKIKEIIEPQNLAEVVYEKTREEKLDDIKKEVAYDKEMISYDLTPMDYADNEKIKRVVQKKEREGSTDNKLLERVMLAIENSAQQKINNPLLTHYDQELMYDAYRNSVVDQLLSGNVETAVSLGFTLEEARGVISKIKESNERMNEHAEKIRDNLSPLASPKSISVEEYYDPEDLGDSNSNAIVRNAPVVKNVTAKKAIDKIFADDKLGNEEKLNKIIEKATTSVNTQSQLRTFMGLSANAKQAVMDYHKMGDNFYKAAKKVMEGVKIPLNENASMVSGDISTLKSKLGVELDTVKSMFPKLKWS